MTGSVPAFIEALFNVNADSMSQDNLIYQLKNDGLLFMFIN